MIHICEEAMETIEKGDGVDDRFNPISSVNAMKTKLTYTKWICFLQIIFAFAGLSGAILVLLDNKIFALPQSQLLRTLLPEKPRRGNENRTTP